MKVQSSDFFKHFFRLKLGVFNLDNKDHYSLRPTIVSGITYSSVTTIPNPWCVPGKDTTGGGADDGGPTPNC